MNFTAIAHLDVHELAASLREKAGLFKPDPEQPGIRIVHHRGFKKGSDEADEMFTGYTATAKWVELANMVKRIRRLGAEEAEFGRIFLEMLNPGAMLPWAPAETSPYFARFLRAHLPLRTSPAAVVYSGAESASLGHGWFTVVNMRVPHCAVNLGEFPRVHLVCDFRRKVAEVV